MVRYPLRCWLGLRNAHTLICLLLTNLESLREYEHNPLCIFHFVVFNQLLFVLIQDKRQLLKPHYLPSLSPFSQALCWNGNV